MHDWSVAQSAAPAVANRTTCRSAMYDLVAQRARSTEVTMRIWCRSAKDLRELDGVRTMDTVVAESMILKPGVR
jgi:hypothetical protein